jgi:hypothetical protein
VEIARRCLNKLSNIARRLYLSPQFDSGNRSPCSTCGGVGYSRSSSPSKILLSHSQIWTHHGLTKFIPLGLEALGGMSKNLRVLLLNFCLSLEDFVQDSKSVAFKFMIKRVSVELHRCNAQRLFVIMMTLIGDLKKFGNLRIFCDFSIWIIMSK